MTEALKNFKEAMSEQGMVEKVLLMDVFNLANNGDERTFWGFTFQGRLQIGVRAKTFEDAVKKAYGVEGVSKDWGAICTPFPANEDYSYPDADFKEIK